MKIERQKPESVHISYVLKDNTKREHNLFSFFIISNFQELLINETWEGEERNELLIAHSPIPKILIFLLKKKLIFFSLFTLKYTL